MTILCLYRDIKKEINVEINNESSILKILKDYVKLHNPVKYTFIIMDLDTYTYYCWCFIFYDTILYFIFIFMYNVNFYYYILMYDYYYWIILEWKKWLHVK